MLFCGLLQLPYYIDGDIKILIVGIRASTCSEKTFQSTVYIFDLVVRCEIWIVVDVMRKSKIGGKACVELRLKTLNRAAKVRNLCRHCSNSGRVRCSHHGWDQERNQDSDNGDDDKQFDQGKCMGRSLPSCKRRSIRHDKMVSLLNSPGPFVFWYPLEAADCELSFVANSQCC